MAFDQASGIEYSKVQAIIDHCRQLLRWSRESPNASVLFPDPEPCFNSLPLSRDEVSASDLFSLQDLGVQLWNILCGLNRDARDSSQRKLNATARAFAYFVLESASGYRLRKSTQDSPRAQPRSFARSTLRIAVTIARECLACDLIDLAEKIVECLAKHQGQLETSAKQYDESDEDLRARADIFLLRITHAWKRGRLDIAEHFYLTLHKSVKAPTTSWAGDAADLCYEVASSALEASQADLAVKWLRHALAALEKVDQETNQLDISALQLNASHALVRALLATDEPEAGKEALSLLKKLNQTHGQELPVMLLELEILSKEPFPAADPYFAVVSKITRCVHIIEQNHKIIMHHIHRLKAVSLTYACRALKNYIVQRLASEDDGGRIESAIVTLIWMATSDAEDPGTVDGLSENLEAVYASWRNSLDAEAAHAAALTIWKCVNAASEDKREVSAAWCRIGLHPLLDMIGEHNKAKLQRKLMHYYLDCGNLDEATRIHAELSPSARKDILSNYLGYLLALRLQDDKAADATIGLITAASDHDPQLLLACIGETMKYGSQKWGALLMQHMLDKLNHKLPATVDRCALLRCTARLQLSVLEQDADPDQEHVAMVCSVFRAAAIHTDSCNGSQSGESSSRCPFDECAWFEKMSFNTALKHVNHWPTKATIDILAHSSAVIYPENATADQAAQQKRHRLCAAFLQTILFARQARDWEDTDTIEDIPRTSYHARSPPDPGRLQRHLYENILMRYQQLRSAVSDQAEDAMSRDHWEELKSKTAATLPLAFEAQLFVALSDAAAGMPFQSLSLSQIIDDIPSLTGSSRPFMLLADLVLASCISRSPTAGGPSTTLRMPAILPIEHAVDLLGRLITAMRRLNNGYDVDKAARWIRCVVQLVLDSRNKPAVAGEFRGEENLELILPIVNEATKLANSSVTSGKEHPQQQGSAHDHNSHNADVDQDASSDAQLYPADELQWLSTVLFNLAIDLYVAEKGDEAQTWAKRAVEVAEALGLVEQAQDRVKGGGGSRGRLAVLLREKGKQVGWKL